MREDLYRRLKQALDEQELAVLATVVEGPGAGAQLLRVGDESLGSLGDDALEAPVRAAVEGVRVSFGAETVRQEVAEGTAVVFVEALPPSPKLVVVGAVHTAIPLVHFANLMGLRTYVVDPRSVFLTEERFGHAHHVSRQWPQEALAEIGLDANTFVAVLSHDDKFDVPALALAAASPARYVGALGSKKTHARRLAALREQGLDDAQLARIHSPIGLDLGGRRPEEIALAVMAEMVQASHRGEGAPSR